MAAPALGNGDVTDAEEVHEIERVVYAEKKGNQWVLGIKWAGHDQVTEMTRANLQRETCNEEIAQEIESCIAAARARNAALGLVPHTEDTSPEAAPPSAAPNVLDVPGPPSRRLRSQGPAPVLLLAPDTSQGLGSQYAALLQASFMLLDCGVLGSTRDVYCASPRQPVPEPELIAAIQPNPLGFDPRGFVREMVR